MIVKALVLAALAASTPLALFASQDPTQKGPARTPAAAPRTVDTVEAELRRANANLVRARAELQEAQRDLAQLRVQLDAALDRIEEDYIPERDRNCAPSRGRGLMTHYRWLRDQGHEQRANGALAKVVERVGEDRRVLGAAARELMTDKETAGLFDEVALALVQRMEQGVDEQGDARARQRAFDPEQYDTAALAYFLNGQPERAVELQRVAIERGGRGDDYRRRLRTYEAALVAIGKARRAVPPSATMAADDED